MSDVVKIYKQISAVMKEVGPIGKNQRVQSGPARFAFRGVDDVYNALSPLMAKHGVFTSCQIIEKEYTEIKSAKGTRGFHARILYRYTFFAEDGSKFECDAIGEGMDYGDKVSNKCAAVAHKYALTQVFCVAYDQMDDPDKETHAVADINKNPLVDVTIKGLLQKITSQYSAEEKTNYFKTTCKVSKLADLYSWDDKSLSDLVITLKKDMGDS